MRFRKDRKSKAAALLLTGFFAVGLAAAGTPALSGAVSALAADGAAAAVQNGAEDASGRTEYQTLEQAIKAWTDGKCLVLLADCAAEKTVAVAQGESKSISLDGHTLSLAAGKKGSVLSADGTLTLFSRQEGGKITGGNAEQGGGIDIGAKGSVHLSGDVGIENNKADEGGGIYCGGTLSLAGAVTVEGNTNGNGEADNLFLTNHNFIKTSDFTGRAGVGVVSKEEKFAEGTGDGKFVPDDQNYIAERRGDGWYLALAPLAAVRAEYLSERKIFPTSDLETLKEGIVLSGTNVNGAPYSGEIGSYVLSAPEGGLKIGENEISLTTESGISTTFPVTVEKPSLLSLSATFSRGATVYADTPLDALPSQLTVTGTFDDGRSREICQTSEETAKKCGEDYIDEFYTLSGDLSEREGDLAFVTVSCGELSARAGVQISRRYIDVTAFTAQEVSIMQGESPALGVYAFLPDWKDKPEIIPEPKIDGKAIDFAALPFGVYSVEISFLLQNERDYELSEGTIKTRLLVYSDRFEGKTGDLSFTVFCEGGISPEWDFSLTDTTAESKTDPGDGLNVERAFTLTFFPGPGGAEEKNFSVRMYLPDSLLDEDLTLLRAAKDGSLREVSFERKGETDGETLRRYIEFEAGDLLEARFLFASDSHATLYLILAICFGVLCAAGAGVLVWYFVRKRKLRLRE